MPCEVDGALQELLVAIEVHVVEGENLRPVTWVRINEFEGSDWAIGGNALRATDVRALAAGKAA